MGRHLDGGECNYSLVQFIPAQRVLTEVQLIADVSSLIATLQVSYPPTSDIPGGVAGGSLVIPSRPSAHRINRLDQTLQTS